jgi:hypothetical protein
MGESCRRVSIGGGDLTLIDRGQVAVSLPSAAQKSRPIRPSSDEYPLFDAGRQDGAQQPFVKGLTAPAPMHPVSS